MFQCFVLLLSISYGLIAQHVSSIPGELIPETAEDANVSLVPMVERTTESTSFTVGETEEASAKKREHVEDAINKPEPKNFEEEPKNVLIKTEGSVQDAPDEVGVLAPNNIAAALPTNMTLNETNRTLTNETRTTTPKPKIPCRVDTEWTCKDFGCIEKDNVCDGVIDCDDASDEYRETCKDHDEVERRQLFGLILHCSSFWSDYHSMACPEICSKEPEYCYYALNAEHGEDGTCVFPAFPEHGWYIVKPNDTDNAEKPVFRLKYGCDEPYVLVEEANLECWNGTWENENATRYCSEACPVVKRDNFTYSCPIDRDTGSDICGKYVAINTTITVSRIPGLNEDGGKQTDPVVPILVNLQCMPVRKKFNMSTDCVQAIDDLQNNFEKPTMEKMTTYETSFNHIKSNDTKHDSEFNKLVNEFHQFEKEVKDSLNMMHQKAEECDIVLDLMLLDLEDKQKAKAATTPNPLLPVSESINE